MKISKFTPAFSVLESLTVIAIMSALFFVLAPPVLYKLGWLTPPARDVDFQFLDVEHPTAPRLPEKFRDEANGSSSGTAPQDDPLLTK